MYDIRGMINRLTVSDVVSIAEANGVDVQYRSGRPHICCPGHLARLGKADSNNSSCVITERGYHCFACGESVDVIDMLVELGCSTGEAIRQVASYLGETELSEDSPQRARISKSECDKLGLNYETVKGYDDEEFYFAVYGAALIAKQEIEQKIDLFTSREGKGAAIVYDICNVDGELPEDIMPKLYNSYISDIKKIDDLLERIGLC